MRWSKLREWFNAWCPKESLRRAIIFQSVRQTPMLNLATSSMFAIFLLGLSLSILFRGLLGLNQILQGVEALTGYLRLFSTLPLCFLVYLCIQWFQLTRISTFGLKTMISLIFGFYGLNFLHGEFNLLPHFLNLVNYPDFFYLTSRIAVFSLSIIFGFSLFRLSSYYLERYEINTRRLWVTLMCLASYGVLGILSFIEFIYGWYVYGYGVTQYDLLNTTLWSSQLGILMGHVTFFLFSIDVFKSRGLRKRSVYLTFLSIGAAWLVREGSFLLKNIMWFSRFHHFYNPPAETVLAFIPMILSYLLVIAVSYSLVKGGRWEGKNFKLSLAAIFLYVGTHLFLYSYSLPYSLSLITNLNIFFERPPVGIPNLLISLPYLISLLIIGLWLYREGEQWVKGWSPEETLGSPKIVNVTGRFLGRARGALTQKKFIGGVSAFILIVLLSLSLLNAWDGKRITIYFDDLSIYEGENLVFSDIFDSTDMESIGWLDIDSARIQKKYFHSPKSGLVLRVRSQGGEDDAGVRHILQIGEGWETLNCTIWVMVPKLEPITEIRSPTGVARKYFYDINNRYILDSWSNLSDIGWGVKLRSLTNDTCHPVIWLKITYRDNGTFLNRDMIENHTVTLTPYRWYRMSLIVDSISEQVQLYFDQDLVAQLPFDVNFFTTFDDFGLRWGFSRSRCIKVE